MARLNVRDFGTALSFDGVNDYVSIPDSSALKPSAPFSVSFWIRSNQTGNKVIFEKDGNNGYSIQTDSDSILKANVGNATALKANKLANDQSWHFIAYVFSTTPKIYIDAVDCTSISSNNTPIYSTGPLYIGSRAGVAPFRGNIDESRIWNRALTASEVSELYYNGLTRGSALATGLVGEWLFNEGSGSTAYDTSGNGNHGTITGATYTTDVPMVARGSVPNTGTMKLRRKSADGEMLVNSAPTYLPDGTVATSTNGRWIDGTAVGSTTDDASGWAYTGEYAGSARLVDGTFELVATGAPPSNNHRVDINHVRASDSGGRSNMLAYCIPLEANTTYRVEYDVKLVNISNANSRGFRILASTYNADATASTGYGSDYQNGSMDWNRQVWYFNVGTQRGMLRFSMEIRGETGAAYIKNISLKKGIPTTRTLINGNLIRNGDFKYTPPFTTATTTSSRWIDGTAAGSTTNKTFGWAAPNSAFSGIGSNISFTTTDEVPTISLQAVTSSGVVKASSVLSTTSPSRSDLLVLLPNTPYICTFKVKTLGASANSVFLDILELTGALGAVVTNSSTKFTGDNDWSNVVLSFTTNATTRYGYLLLRINIAGDNQNAWFADIQLKPTTPQTRQTA